ncbi:MAG TPA: DNA/pantothenate metabolism flavoprotein domain protein [Verrucomicrobiales bacterium]|nr:DNA/pantothenate metabolism flavoprotein domain protein [Verrucomicrobiales bacterium]
MRVIVTAGPTYESLDSVRRLTNFSTGRLGTELAGHFAMRGHEVTLLIGEQATWRGDRRAAVVEVFGTTEDLFQRLRAHAHAGTSPVDGVFHAAAVSDFTFGKVWERGPSGELIPAQGGKLTTRSGSLLAELVPTPKILPELRGWFPKSFLSGWKFETDGPREQVVAKARSQIRECKTDLCVANGPGFGEGFGLVTPGDAPVDPVATPDQLFLALERRLAAARGLS